MREGALRPQYWGDDPKDPNWQNLNPEDGLHGVYGQAYDTYQPPAQEDEEAMAGRKVDQRTTFVGNFTKACNRKNDCGIIIEFIWCAKKK
eukprot:12800119-Heterocapsa_arctica.AAC.1